LLGLVTLLAGLIVVLVYSVIAGYISAQDARNDFLKKEIAVLDKQIDQIKRLKEQSDALMERKRIIESLQRDRAEAVRLLSELAKQMPEGVYLRSLKQEGQRISLGRLCPVQRPGVDADAQHRSIAVAGKTAVAGNQGRDWSTSGASMSSP
jgi:type IV pilus assembly protein PilN